MEIFIVCSKHFYNRIQPIKEELKSRLAELNIPLTPREEFDGIYSYYKENWRRLIE